MEWEVSCHTYAPLGKATVLSKELKGQMIGTTATRGETSENKFVIFDAKSFEKTSEQ